MNFEAWKNKARDEDQQRGSAKVIYGHDSARQGFPVTFNGLDYLPNHAYNLPDYYLPVDLDDPNELSDLRPTQNPVIEEDRGKDAWAIHGFFNKAKARFWCDDIYGRLDKIKKDYTEGFEELRDKEVATCAYLAQRTYKQVDPRYSIEGIRFEKIGMYTPYVASGDFNGDGRPDVPVGGYGEDFEPICAYLKNDAGETSKISAYEDDKKVYFLHPGYVENAGKIGDLGLSPKSLENWCNRIPVINFANSDEPPQGLENLHNEVLGGRIGLDKSNGFRFLRLSGENFGIKTPTKVGQVILKDLSETDATLNLDIFDSETGEFSGGWSLDNRTLTAQIPLVGRGVGSNANSDMLPHEILAVAGNVYELSIEQPDDPPLAIDFRSEGRQSVGIYNVVVFPTTEVVVDNFVGIQKKSYFATFPEWLRDQAEILTFGLFVVNENGVRDGVDSYTPIETLPGFENFPVQITMDGWFDLTNDPDNENFTRDPDRVGLIVRGDSEDGFPSVFTENTIAFVFAYH